jgi:hypothetical protein
MQLLSQWLREDISSIECRIDFLEVHEPRLLQLANHGLWDPVMLGGLVIQGILALGDYSTVVDVNTDRSFDW